MATAAIPKTKIAGGSFLIEDRRPEEVFTPEDFTDEHRQIAQTTEEFALKEILTQVEKIEHKDYSVSRALIKKASELGLASVDIPEEYGGMDMDKVTSAIIADYIAKSGSFSVTWGAHVGIGTLPIVYFGTPEKSRSIYRSSLQASGWERMHSRNLRQGQTHSTAAAVPIFRQMVSTMCSMARRCGSRTPNLPISTSSSRKWVARSSRHLSSSEPFRDSLSEPRRRSWEFAAHRRVR